MLFCKGCGTKLTAAYCPGCGAVKSEEWTQVNIDLVEEKYCAGCGKPVVAAFCGACGKQRKTVVTVGKASAFAGFGSAVASAYTAATPDNAPAGIPSLPVPIEVLLMSVMFLFALSTHSLLTGFALFFAVLPALIAKLLPKLYESLKGIVNVAAGGVALLFVIFSLALADFGLNIVGFLFSLVVLAVIIFIGLRDLIELKLPPALENFMSYIDGPMYFYWVALLLSLTALFRRTVFAGTRRIDEWPFFEAYYQFSFSRFIWMAIFTILLLLPVVALAYFIWQKLTHLFKIALAAMTVSGVMSLIFIPVIFRRRYLVPMGYIVLGYLGVLLVALIVFLLKDYVMELFKSSGAAAANPVYAPHPGQPTPMQAQASYPGAPVQGMPPHGAPMPGHMPMGMLDTNRSLLKFILLSMVTFGIYGIIKMCIVSQDINTIASRHDGKNTILYILAILLGSITLGIYTLIWFHTFSDRMGMELRRRGIPFQISSTDFWLWFVLGSLFIAGPFIYYHKVLTAMNHLSADYNARG
ncbi:MAG: DUF4234 domain-containing protein [Defluviitaleaceae bacterium]|nr:DUF4234 domain-containing protein [Defluviitaleaceae bacterium]